MASETQPSGKAGQLPYPGDMAPYPDVDAWLMDRGWERFVSVTWRLVRGVRVTIATHGEAVKIQKRRDAQRRRRP
jgi:hypothetical protein